jgi:hypothetical protein
MLETISRPLLKRRRHDNHGVSVEETVYKDETSELKVEAKVARSACQLSFLRLALLALADFLTVRFCARRWAK